MEAGTSGDDDEYLDVSGQPDDDDEDNDDSAHLTKDVVWIDEWARRDGGVPGSVHWQGQGYVARLMEASHWIHGQ